MSSTPKYPTLDIVLDNTGAIYSAGDDVWMVSELIAASADLPVFDLPVAGLFIGSQVWGDSKTPKNLARHIKRVLEADLSYPVIMDEEGFIMDGWHRVTKALVEGISTIKAVRFPKNPEPSYTRTSQE